MPSVEDLANNLMRPPINREARGKAVELLRMYLDGEYNGNELADRWPRRTQDEGIEEMYGGIWGLEDYRIDPKARDARTLAIRMGAIRCILFLQSDIPCTVARDNDFWPFADASQLDRVQAQLGTSVSALASLEDRLNEPDRWFERKRQDMARLLGDYLSGAITGRHLADTWVLARKDAGLDLVMRTLFVGLPKGTLPDIRSSRKRERIAAILDRVRLFLQTDRLCLRTIPRNPFDKSLLLITGVLVFLSPFLAIVVLACTMSSWPGVLGAFSAMFLAFSTMVLTGVGGLVLSARLQRRFFVTTLYRRASQGWPF